jgi:hypothetical protein
VSLQGSGSTGGFPRTSLCGGRWAKLTAMVFISAALGAVVTLVAVQSSDSTSPTIARSASLQAGFRSNSMTIVDQLGTVNVNVWVKNEGRVAASATCAVIVVSGSGMNSYRDSAAFRLSSIAPNKSRHLVEVVTGVYLGGDATAPIGSRYLPIPQSARLSKGSLVKCM